MIPVEPEPSPSSLPDSSAEADSPRLGILHLMVWIACVAVYLGLDHRRAECLGCGVGRGVGDLLGHGPRRWEAISLDALAGGGYRITVEDRRGGDVRCARSEPILGRTSAGF